MGDVFTLHNILQMAFGAAVLFVVYTIGILIGASVKWLRDTLAGPDPDDDPA